MKNIAFFIALVTLLAFSMFPHTASAASSRRTTITNKSSSWAWVTGYDGKGDHASGPAFCVAPGQTRTERWMGVPSSMPVRLRFEMTSTNCAHPRYADLWEDFHGIVRFDIHGSPGGYKIHWWACHGSPQYCS